MNSPADFNRFLSTLHQKINENPARRLQILQQEIARTNCPYLKAKLLEECEHKGKQLLTSCHESNN